MKSFSSRGWNGKTLWRRSGSENIHLDPGSPRPRGRTRQSSRRIRQTLFSNPISRRLNTGWCGSWKWLLDDFRRIHFSSSRRTQSQTVRAERRIISYATEICQRDQDSKYIVGCIVGEKYPRLLERWWRSRIGRYVDRLHKIHCVGWKTTGWIYVVPGETDKRTNDLQTRHFVAWDLERYVWCVEMQRKSKSVLSRNRSSTMLEICVVFTSLILMMRNSKLSWRMRIESWKFRCQPQCLANLNVRSTGKPIALKTIARSNTLALLRPMNLRGSTWNDLFTRIMKIILQENEKSLSHNNLVRKFIPMLQAMKNTSCNNFIGERMGKLEKYQHGSWRSQKQKRGDRWSKEYGQNCSCCVVNGSLSSQEFVVGATVSEIERSSRTQSWHCKRWFRILCSIHRAGIISITNDGCKK